MGWGMGCRVVETLSFISTDGRAGEVLAARGTEVGCEELAFVIKGPQQ